MAMDNETIRLAFQVDTAAVKAGTVATKELKGAIDAVGVSSTNSFTAMAHGASRSGVVTANAMAQAGGGAQRASYGFLMLSQAVEDAQYGFSAVVNNIPGMVMAFGGSAGLAGGLSIAAVGVNLLLRHSSDLAELTGLGGTKTEAERMAELGKETNKTAEATAELLKYKREQADIAKTDTLTSKDSKVQGKAVETAIGEAQKQGGEVSGAVAAQMLQTGAFKDGDMEKKIKDLREQGLVAMADAFQKQDDDRRRNEAQLAAKDLVGGAINDPKKLDALIGHFKAKPEQFAPGFLGDLENAKPENIKKQAEYEEAGRVRGLKLEAETAKKKKWNADAESLTAQGKDIENDLRKQKEKETEDRRLRDLNFAINRAGNPRGNDGGHGAAGGGQGHGGGGGFNNAEIAMNRQSSLMDRIGDASGLQDPIAMALYQARQRGLSDRNLQRRMQGMTLEQKEAVVGKINDQADAQAKNLATQQILRSGLTRSPVEARAVAESLVNRARGAVNGQTGDPATIAAEKQTKELQANTAALVALKGGIPLKLDN